MSCCGDRRAKRAWLLPNFVRLRYLGNERARIVGYISGAIYEFSEQDPEIDVDARDAAELIKSPSFVLATVH